MKSRETHQEDGPQVIPGVLELRLPAGEPIPVVFDSPHSGNEYPADFGFALPLHDLRSAEDMYVDELFASAPARGAALLRALFPRSYVDVNRNPADIDVSLLSQPWPGEVRIGGKTRNGKGLIRAQAQGCPIYGRSLPVSEIKARLARYYEPYHAELAAQVSRLRRTFGAVWHIDCHSWTPPETGRDGLPLRHVDFFLGNRDHTTCGEDFIQFVAEFLVEKGYVARVNRLFKGMELVKRHGKPDSGQYSLQIEINRNLYMGRNTYAKLPGFDHLQMDLDGLISAICQYARANLRTQTPAPVIVPHP